VEYTVTIPESDAYNLCKIQHTDHQELLSVYHSRTKLSDLKGRFYSNVWTRNE